MPREISEGPTPLTLSGRLRDYLQVQDQARRATALRVLGAMGAQEQSLVRESAVMGYVQGTRHPVGQPIPGDQDVVALVISACLAFDDLYPTVASYAPRLRPLSPGEQTARALVEIHHPRCGCPANACTCAGGPVCATCAPAHEGSGPMPEPWPCASVRALGRVAWCTNTLEREDLTASRCSGLLIFRPHEAQARCLTCGAWCGADVACYVAGLPAASVGNPGHAGGPSTPAAVR